MGISNHALHNDFPQFSDLINELKANDLAFGQKCRDYAELDQEIEGLEKRDAPIGDDKLHRLKQKRAQLKDELYQTLSKNAQGS